MRASQGPIAATALHPFRLAGAVGVGEPGRWLERQAGARAAGRAALPAADPAGPAGARALAASRPRHQSRSGRAGWITACRAPQASDSELHLQALQALHSLGRGGKASGAHSLPVEDVQTAFGRGGGLPLLVGLLDTAVTPKPGAAAQPAAVTQRAVGALTAMTRNHAANRRAGGPRPRAIFSNIIHPTPAMGAHGACPPPSQEAGNRRRRCARAVLGAEHGRRGARLAGRAQGAVQPHCARHDRCGPGRSPLAGAAARAYAADPGRRAGHTCSEVFASGGVHALVRRAAAPRGAPLAAWRARQRARADPPARGSTPGLTRRRAARRSACWPTCSSLRASRSAACGRASCCRCCSRSPTARAWCAQAYARVPGCARSAACA